MTTLLMRWIGGDGFKPRDVEEAIDYYWHRPLAARLVRLLATTRVTPNQVTGLSALASLVAGLLMGLSALYGSAFMVLGGLTLLLSIVLDCCDGQLARIRGESSIVGRALDGMADSIAPTAVFHGMVFHLLAADFPHLWVWPAGWCAALSLIWHASVYDVTKNVFLHMMRPDFNLGGASLLSANEVEQLGADLRKDGRRFDAAMVKVWHGWTKAQNGAIERWRPRAPRNDEERQLFNELLTPSMRAMSWLGFGTHLFLLTVAAITAYWSPIGIWMAWFVIAGPMNVWCVWVLWRQKARSNEFVRRQDELRTAESAGPRAQNG